MFTSSTPTSHRRLAARPSAAALFDAAAATLMLLAHGGIEAIRPGSGIGASQPGSGELDLVAVVLAACVIGPNGLLTLTCSWVVIPTHAASSTAGSA